MDKINFDNIKRIPYDYDEEKRDLNNVLKEARLINEIQSELSSFIDQQDDDINMVEQNIETAAILTHKSSHQLELASGKKFKLSPIIIGSVVGASLTLPLTVGLATPGIIIGYAAGGGALLGGVIGKKLA